MELRRSAQYDAAAKLLTGWLGGDRTDDPVVFMLAEVYVALGKPDEAVKVWLELLEQQPPQEHRFRQVAQRARQIRREATAIQVLLDARLRLGESDLFSFELGELYLLRGEFDEAVGNFVNCLSLADGQYDQVERLLLPHASAHLQPAATTAGESPASSFGRRRPDESPRCRGGATSLARASGYSDWPRQTVRRNRPGKGDTGKRG